MSFEQSEEILLITADEVGNWREEKVSVAGIRRMLSERFSPEYREQMQTLRETDDVIRAWSNALKDTVKELKKAFRAGRIIDVAILFARFNKHLHTVVDIGKDVEVFYERSLAEFESGHELDDLSDIEELGGKTAGVVGDLARKYIAKRIYNKEIKERNMAIRRLISKAELVYKTIDTYLDEMKSAKKAGDIGKYVDYLRKISAKQKGFEAEFLPAYNRYLKRSIDLMKEREAAKPQKGEIKGDGPVPNLPIDVPGKPQEVSAPVPLVTKVQEGPVTQDIDATPFAPTVNAPAMFERPVQPEIGVEMAKSEPPTGITRRPLPPVEPVEPQEEADAPDTFDDYAPLTQRSGSSKLEENKMIKAGHEEFVKELQKLALEYNDPKLIAMALLTYAEAIEEEDLDGSLKLMALAEGVLNA